jgi:hypothetical protein
MTAEMMNREALKKISRDDLTLPLSLAEEEELVQKADLFIEHNGSYISELDKLKRASNRRSVALASKIENLHENDIVRKWRQAGKPRRIVRAQGSQIAGIIRSFESC